MRATIKQEHGTVNDMLEGEGVSKNFGAFWVLREVDFTIIEGEIVCLTGPNGAGKIALFNVITGAYRPSKGKISLNGIEISSLLTQKVG